MSTSAPPKTRRKSTTSKDSPAPSAIVVPDPIVEMLTRYGFKYELVELNLSDINRKVSEHNQARIATPIDEDQVVVYATQMEAGDLFPPIVVYKKGTFYIVMDGNHRVAASDLTEGKTTISAYVVEDPSPAQVQSFTYEANTKHGMPTSLNDRLQQAIHLVGKEVPAGEAAKRLGIPYAALRTALDTYQAEQRFQKLGVRRFADLTSSTKRKLDTIHSDVVLKAAAELVLDARMNSTDLGTFVREINQIRTEREAVKAVNAQRENLAPTIKSTASGRIPVPQGVITLQRVISTINKMDEDKVAAQLHDLPTEVREAHARAVSDAVTVLLQIVRGVQRRSQA